MSAGISDRFMTADIDNILKERSKEVVFTDNGYQDVDDLFATSIGEGEIDSREGKRIRQRDGNIINMNTHQSYSYPYLTIAIQVKKAVQQKGKLNLNFHK